MIDGALAALDDGDIRPLGALLAAAADLGERPWSRLWHAVSTLRGRVVGRVVIVEGDARLDGVFSARPPIVAGGPPRAVAAPHALGRELADAIDPPPTAEDHRGAALATLAALEAGTLPGWAIDPSAALLRHHTELPVDIPPRLPVTDAAAEGRMLATQLEPLRSPGTFLSHLEAGRTSPSAARRCLSRRLLALTG